MSRRPHPARPRPAALAAAIALFLPGCGGGGDVGGTIYWCSMHPEVRQPEPGTCALCGGMRLVPLDEGLASEEGVLVLDDAQVQQAGVRLASVERRDLVRPLDLPARFALDPRTESTVHSPIPGSSRVAAVHFPAAGQRVQAGAVLVELENDLLAQQVVQLRDAVARYEELKAEPGRERQAEEMLRRKETIQAQLEDAGVTREWSMLLAHEGRRREGTPRFPVHAERDGTILRTPTLQVGGYVRQGEALFHLADTSQLWLELDAHERDLAWLSRGLRVRYETPAVPGERFWTTLDAVETVADEGRPAVRVRARATDAKGRILPGTWARARVLAEAPDVLAVPASAVLRSGARDVALIAEGDGRFRPVAVELGRRDLSPAPSRATQDADPTAGALVPERYHEVLGGLAAGDRVVTAGSFLLLSEANFQGALAKLTVEPRAATATPPALAAALPALLADYEALRAALADDDAARLAAPAAALRSAAGDLEPEELSPATDATLERLAAAARALDTAARGAAAEDPALLEVRRAFGSLSREVVALVRAHARERVERGELHLFRCPMAEEYGFDLWLQAPAEMANPYMGRRMLACGVAAEL